MAESVELHGFTELYERLNNADAKRIKPSLRTSLRAGGKVVLAEARSKTPVAEHLSKAMVNKGYAPGDLRKSLRVRATPGRARGTVGVSVVTSESGNMFKGKQFYGGMVHYGTKRMKAQPWLREAFDATKSSVLAAIQKGLVAVLEKLGV